MKIPGYGPLNLAGVAGGMLLLLATRFYLLLFVYLLLTITSYFWSGLVKFTKVIFFPGLIFHYLAHVTAAKVLGKRIWGENPHQSFLHSLGWGRGFTRFYPKDVKLRYVVPYALAPTFLALSLFALFSLLLPYARGMLQTVVAWLMVSALISGMSDLADWHGILQTAFIAHTDQTVVTMLLGPLGVVFLLVGAGRMIATIGGVIYYVIVIPLLAKHSRVKKELEEQRSEAKESKREKIGEEVTFVG